MSHLPAQYPRLEPVGAILSSTGVNVTITLTTTIHPVSGVGLIQTISGPYTGFTGRAILIPTGAFALVTGGNIASAATAVVNRPLDMTFDGTLWYPSYF